MIAKESQTTVNTSAQTGHIRNDHGSERLTKELEAESKTSRFAAVTHKTCETQSENYQVSQSVDALPERRPVCSVTLPAVTAKSDQVHFILIYLKLL